MGAVNLPSSYSKRYPHMLSGGECQRATLARAIANNPSLLLCDEMTSALDGQTQAEVLAVLNDLKQKNQLAGLVITHDLTVAESYVNAYIYWLKGHCGIGDGGSCFNQSSIRVDQTIGRSAHIT